MRLTKVEVLRETVKIVVAALSAKSIPVTQSGSNAFIEWNAGTGAPKRINIPFVPDNGSDRLIKAVQGFVDHECAHVLFTDFKVVKSAKAAGAAAMHNILEDTYIERNMKELYRGSRHNLNEVWGFIAEEMLREPIDAAIASGEQKRIIACGMPIAIHAWAGNPAAEKFMATRWEAFEKIKDIIGPKLIEQVPEIEDSREALVLAVAIQNRITEWGEEEKEREKAEREEKRKKEEGEKDDSGMPGEPSTEGESGDGETGDEAGDDMRPADETSREDSEPSDETEPSVGGGDSEDEDGEPEDPKEAGGSGEDESEDDGDAGGEDETKSADPSEPEEDESASKDDATEDEKAAEDEDESADVGEDSLDEEEEEEEEPSAAEEDVKEILEGLDEMEDLEDLASKMIKEEMEEALSTSRYWPITKDFDRIERYHPSRIDSDYIDRTQREIRQHVGVLQKHLERLIAARSYSRHIPGFRSGRLHGAALHRVSTGDDRVFRRRHDFKTKDVDVQLVVDLSGSMTGRKVKLACECAYGLGEALDRLNINSQIIGFTTCDTPSRMKKVEREVFAEHSKSPSRVEPIYMPILKDWNQRFTADRKAATIMAAKDIVLYNNVDGESIEYAARSLAAQPGSRKLMIVLSDGQPCASGNRGEQHTHLINVIKRFEKEGMEIFGIGILDDSVKNYYSNYEVVEDISSLSTTVLETLRKMLLRRVA